MPKGKLRKRNEKKEIPVVDDTKIRKSLMLMLDKYDEGARNLIIATYNDKDLLQKYIDIRRSGVFQKGGKSKVHRKLIEFPNPTVFDFADTVLSKLYGEEWMYDNRALKHDLCKPWWVVERL